MKIELKYVVDDADQHMSFAVVSGMYTMNKVNQRYTLTLLVNDKLPIADSSPFEKACNVLLFV